MTHFFPRASLIVCSRHLKENVQRKLDKLMGKSTPLRAQLLNTIFGDKGLIGCDDVVSFDNAVENFRAGQLLSAPAEFTSYFNGRVLKLMRENVIAKRNKWTNNNCESINHVLKQAVQWRPNQMPELVDKIRALVDGQFSEADRALCGRGDFALGQAYARHRLTPDLWSTMTVVQRERAADACFRLVAAPSSTSTDGVINVPLTPGGGKKLNQRKRIRNAKTLTFAKKHKPVNSSTSDLSDN